MRVAARVLRLAPSAGAVPPAAQVFVLAQRAEAVDVTDPLPWPAHGEAAWPAAARLALDDERANATDLVAMLDAAGDGVGGEGDDDEELATGKVDDAELLRGIRADATSFKLAPRWVTLKAVSDRAINVRVEVEFEVTERKVDETPVEAPKTLPIGADAVRCGLPNAAPLTRGDAATAARLDDTTLLRRVLAEHPDAATAVGGPNQETPLHVAARHGAIDAANVLVAAGSDASAVDAHGRTPLHVATLAGHASAAEALLAACGSTAVTLAAECIDSAGFAPLDYAAAHGTCAEAFRTVCGEAAWDAAVSRFAA